MTPTELRAAIDRTTGGNISAFARLIGVSRRIVNYWLSGRVIPRFTAMYISDVARKGGKVE